MIAELFTTTVLVGILASGFRLATPYLYASLGETFGQKSGVLNLGVEGIMLLGAFAAFYTSFVTNNLWLGLLAAIIVGGIMGLAVAVINVTLKAVQGISGIGVFLFGLGNLCFLTLTNEHGVDLLQILFANGNFIKLELVV